MTATYQSLLSDAYLRAIFDREFAAFQGSPEEKALLKRLQKWAAKEFQKETSAEAAFTSVFFEETWGYALSGKNSTHEGFTCWPKFSIGGAGQGGGTGEADAALGCFGQTDLPTVPQVVCEFKDVRSNLDAPQKRKGNNRSPVKQCADYLREAMKPLYGNEAIQPTWGIVTDMNEFRLYWRNTMPSQYQRFIIRKATTDEGFSLLEEGEDASFQRFLFLQLLQARNLLTSGGPSSTLKLLKDQRYREKEIENAFYREYRSYREHLVKLLIDHNPQFPGTKGRLVRLAQKLIDRCIFVMFCEDMGEQLSFPPNALRDYLAELSRSATFEDDEGDAWSKLKELFAAMNEGKRFRARNLNRFNGGLFAADAELESLIIPNSAFCARMQGESDQTLSSHKLTLLYFAGSYNFGTVKRDGQAITLFTLGRIFEQSITELEALEAEADNRESLTVISRRKRDGVYYTPEWIVEKVVAETLGPRLDDIRRELGWSFELEGDEERIIAQTKLAPSRRSAEFNRHVTAVRAFRDRLDKFTVLDPACGSGAFLIHALDYLLRERRRVQLELSLLTSGKGTELFEFKSDEAIRKILSENIFGVDINPASVEIARLALWLHTAKSDQPLTNLDSNIVTGNSLVGPDVYQFKRDLLNANDAMRETINAFRFEDGFPQIFDGDRPSGRGFDCVVGNPPYVKLQNFKRVYPDTADYLKDAPGPDGAPLYQSCQTGNFDLYLPFIEHGLGLLNADGKLGYIAPSVWRFNEYGNALKRLLKKKKSLERWIDFGSFQVFNEAITYTALQFYGRKPVSEIHIALASDGALADIPDWDDPSWTLSYDELPETGPWVFASRPTLDLMAKLKANCDRLDSVGVSTAISQGLISGAFDIFALKKIGDGVYRPQKDKTATDVRIEEQIMKPLISASDIDRFSIYQPSLAIIFPYLIEGQRPKLFSQEKFSTGFPQAWSYLSDHEDELRKRDAGQFAQGGDESDRWFAYSRNQNLDKQGRPKIVIAGTGTQIEAAIDANGSYAANDKRVYSVFPRDPNDLGYLTGILNSRVATFFFRQVARPKDNGYYDIETQFLGPLPIPRATPDQRKKVSSCVDQLIAAHAKRTTVLGDIERRLSACQMVEKSYEWIWPSNVESVQTLQTQAPAEMNRRAKTAWARNKQAEQVQIQVDALAEHIRPGNKYAVSVDKGEMRVLLGGAELISKIFVDVSEAQLLLASWRSTLRAPSDDATVFVDRLRRVPQSENQALIQQLEKLNAELSVADNAVERAERDLEEVVTALFGLTPAEIELVVRNSF